MKTSSAKSWIIPIAGLFVLLSGLAAEPSRRPNVILIISDDQGYGDLSFTGNPVVRTPAIDRLAAEGVRLTDFHVSPTCAPTRAALMTGHDANRTGVWHTIMGRSLLPTSEPTLGELFARGGYATGMFGKWHLGDDPPFRPEDRGFQEVVRHGGGGMGQTPDRWDNTYTDAVYYHNGKPESRPGYCTDVFFSAARDFIAASVANNQPFFAYVATNTPHSPFHAPPAYIERYQQQGLKPEEAVFFAMIANLDDNVGALRTWLRDQGLENNTLIIFMTDNGTATGERIFNAGMKGKKNSEYEGGHRVPCLLYWPDGRITGGRDVSQLSAHVDLYPTLAEVCGLQPPAGYASDGRSLVPLLYSLPVAWPDRTLITDSQRLPDPVKWRKSAIMTQRWRLINGAELYDIVADPGQSHDLAAAYPEIVARMRSAYEEWWQGLQPSFREPARIHVGHDPQVAVDLTCHDWLTEDEITPWNQSLIRQGFIGNGRWALTVGQAGRYRITLRRWPAEAGAALDAPLPAGEKVSGLRAFRETPGVALPIVRATLNLAGTRAQQDVVPGAPAATFDIDLPAGPVDLTTTFELADGRRLGAYYARVERLATP